MKEPLPSSLLSTSAPRCAAAAAAVQPSGVQSPTAPPRVRGGLLLGWPGRKRPLRMEGEKEGGGEGIWKGSWERAGECVLLNCISQVAVLVKRAGISFSSRKNQNLKISTQKT